MKNTTMLETFSSSAAMSGGNELSQSSASTRSNLKLRFRNAPLETVLNYLRESAGLLIHARAEKRIKPTVDLWHEQPVGVSDALLLLKQVLVEKGWIIIQRGPLFDIIDSSDLKKSCIPLPSL